MLFSSATFLFAFLPVVALLYYLIPKRCTAARNLFLTGASLLFYAWGEPRFVLVMLLVIVSSWLFARKIEASAKSARKGFLLVAVSVDLTVLFVFKYLGFFTENLNRLPFVRLPVPQITLPIGISFFTFNFLCGRCVPWGSGTEKPVGCHAVHCFLPAIDCRPHRPLF
jgi:alginate O-acetyltransferase complex protein AlgI